MEYTNMKGLIMALFAWRGFIICVSSEEIYIWKISTDMPFIKSEGWQYIQNVLLTGDDLCIYEKYRELSVWHLNPRWTELYT